MKLFNAHIHAGASPDEVRETLIAGGTGACLCAYDIESSFTAMRAASAGERIVAAVGIHPRYTAELGQDALSMSISLIESMFQNPAVKAIGEIGLDYRPDADGEVLDAGVKDVQSAYFRSQLRLALAFHMPVVVHCVRAHEDCLAILEREGAFSQARRAQFADDKPHVLLHGFSGSPEQLDVFAKKGASFSFGPMILAGVESKITRAAAIAPDSSLMTETDEETDPAQLVRVIDELARLRGSASSEELAKLVSENAMCFYFPEETSA